MAKAISQAKRTNRAVAALAVVMLLGAGASAIWGNGGSNSSTESTTSAPPLNDRVNGPGSRPAELAYTWFDHGMSVEQTDYPMENLSCATLSETITPDICAVAETSHGAFMLAGVEGYWDTSEPDADGLVQIPFDMTLFTMRRDHSIPRATSVMDGFFQKAYTGNKAQIDLYRTSVNDEDVLVLVKRLSDNAPDAYAFTESVQIIAASETGAPTVVATYEGTSIKVGSDGSKIVVSSLRYRTTTDQEETKWFTRLTLTPSKDDPALWIESLSSGPDSVVAGQGMKLMGSHEFAAPKSKRPSTEPSNV